MRGNCDANVDIKSSDFPISDGLDIYITHGNEYSYDKDSKFNRKGILIYGHEHIPLIRIKNEMIYVNTGSISLPRNDIATYAIYENKKNNYI